MSDYIYDALEEAFDSGAEAEGPPFYALCLAMDHARGSQAEYLANAWQELRYCAKRAGINQSQVRDWALDCRASVIEHEASMARDAAR